MKIKQFFLLLVLAASCVACQEQNTNNVTISLSPTLMQLSVGDVDIIEAEVSGGSGTIIWESSNVAVATVMSGVVTAKAEGEATITASIGNASATCMVFVVEGGNTGNFVINKSSFTLEVKRRNNSAWCRIQKSHGRRRTTRLLRLTRLASLQASAMAKRRLLLPMPKATRRKAR